MDSYVATRGGHGFLQYIGGDPERTEERNLCLRSICVVVRGNLICFDCICSVLFDFKYCLKAYFHEPFVQQYPLMCNVHLQYL